MKLDEERQSEISIYLCTPPPNQNQTFSSYLSQNFFSILLQKVWIYKYNFHAENWLKSNVVKIPNKSEAFAAIFNIQSILKI